MNRQLLPDAAKRTIERAPLPPAVVLGTYITGLSQARPLADRGVPVIGVDETRRRYTGYSSAWAHLIVDEQFNHTGLIDLLERLAAECGRTPVLMVSTDEQVKLVSRFAERLHACYAFEYPPAEMVDLLMSKELFAALAREKGWTIPATLSVNTRQALEQGIEALRFPVVLKPRIKNLAARTHTSQKAYRCLDRDALFRAYDDVRPWEPEVVVQEWIPGTDSDVHYSFHYYTADMRELASFEGRKIRQWIPEVGNTASSEPVHPPVVTDMSRTILQSTRCSGFCSVEYKRDPRTGTFYITEPTVGRINLQLGTATANGVDLVARAYYHLAGLPYPTSEERTYDRKWIYLASEVRSARHYIRQGALTWGAWFRSLRGPKRFAVWRASDTGMLLGLVSDTLTRVPRGALRRARRLVSRGRAVQSAR
jgi:predicted ATP-grasp superfamily ATP-dependent carboligase